MKQVHSRSERKTSPEDSLNENKSQDFNNVLDQGYLKYHPSSNVGISGLSKTPKRRLRLTFRCQKSHVQQSRGTENRFSESCTTDQLLIGSSIFLESGILFDLKPGWFQGVFFFFFVGPCTPSLPEDNLIRIIKGT